MSDYEDPAAYWESRPRARKEHKCGECRTQIRPGETYLRVAGVWNGEFDHHKLCGGCERLRDLLQAEGVEIFFGGLYECLEEADVLNPMVVIGVQAR